MALTAGTRIGPYEISAPLGRGGMGEVYRARDPRLKRDVAIKVLPDAFVLDDDRLARFQREAELLATINHSNIAAIYGLEESGPLKGLVLELVEGDTLAELIASAPGLPLDRTLAIARQIADALVAAHEKGIVHRDLKPANIKITPQGQVKVLDFGLAKGTTVATGDVSQSPTMSFNATERGVILGTAAYMSPEQARGALVDTRTDVWAFGCVLFEMLARTPAFAGNTLSDTIANVLARDPDWTKLPGDVPKALEDLIQRCLRKDAAERPQHIRDVRLELDDLSGDDRQPSSRSRARTPGRTFQPRLWLIGVATALGVLALATAGLWMRRQTTEPAVVEPPLQLTDVNDSALHPAISPDGRMLAFIRGGGFGDSAPIRGQIYVKLLPSGEAVQLTRDQYNKEQPVFTPDGSQIIYTAVTEGFRWDSWQVPVLGGTPRPFLPGASGLVWLDQRRVLYSEQMAGVHMGIVTSTASRADHRQIYFPSLEGGMAHRSALSPDGKSVLIVEMDGGGWTPCRLVPFDGSSSGRQVAPPEAQCTTAAWSPDGQWMYFSSNAGGGFHIWRQRYPDGMPEQITSGPTEQEGTAITSDGKYLITSMGIQRATVSLHEGDDERQLTSEGFAMLPTMASSNDRVFYMVRDSGARGYASGELWATRLSSGERERVLPGFSIGSYSISHDDRKVVFTSLGAPGGDGVWIADVDRSSPPRQLTRGGEFRAHFGAPGEIIYLSQETVRHLFRMREDGSGIEQISSDPINNLISVSPDGDWAFVLVPRPGQGGTDMKILSTRGGRPFDFCNAECAMGFGPSRAQAQPMSWSADGTSIVVALQYVAPRRSGRSVILPYRAGVPLDRLWPRGLRTEADIVANPGATVIAEANVFPGSSPSRYLFWRRTTQSNIYRIPIQN